MPRGSARKPLVPEALLGQRGPELNNLWLAWDEILPALLAEDPPERQAVEPASAASAGSGTSSSSSSITTQ